MQRSWSLVAVFTLVEDTYPETWCVHSEGGGVSRSWSEVSVVVILQEKAVIVRFYTPFHQTHPDHRKALPIL